MTNVVLLLTALSFTFGVLMGSVLQTRTVHREYQRIADRVRELRELQEVLVDRQEVPVMGTRSRR